MIVVEQVHRYNTSPPANGFDEIIWREPIGPIEICFGVRAPTLDERDMARIAVGLVKKFRQRQTINFDALTNP